MTARLTIYRDRVRQLARRLSTPRRVQIAHAAAAQARVAAPVVTGDYRDGIGVAVDGDQVLLVDTDEAAIHKEYGTVDTPAHAALTDAARRHGRYSGMRPR